MFALMKFLKRKPLLLDDFTVSNLVAIQKLGEKYIDDTTPWILAKDESKLDRLETVIYNLLNSIRVSAILLQAFIPSTSKKIFEGLKLSETTFESIDNLVKNYASNYLMSQLNMLSNCGLFIYRVPFNS